MIEEFWQKLGQIATTPFNPHSRFYWLYGLTSLLLARLAYHIYEKQYSQKDFWAFCFPSSIYRHSSSILDYKIYLINRLLSPWIQLIVLSTTSMIAIYTTEILRWLIEPGVYRWRWTLFSFFLFTLLFTIVNDFAGFWVHRLYHRVPFLWSFHRVHHSAEVLNPFTVGRLHPVSEIIFVPIQGLFLGIFQGVVYYFFEGFPQFVTVFEVNLFIFLFYVAGNHLRHSQIWLSYGSFWGHIFISPAQHQIHHSVSAQHRNKNFGEILAIWDWLFGSLYVPKTKENLIFGISQDIPNPHTSLGQAYFEPFYDFWKNSYGRISKKEK